jgi:predicted AlkP superfamily phosphohydrolase/phosphomutase
MKFTRAALAGCLGLLVMGLHAATPERRLIVLGMDGLDPVLLRTYISQGRLPNFKALAAEGSMRPLATSNPPQSPVAWSSMITGRNPGEHHVFDFVVRNPDTHLPEVGMTETIEEEARPFQRLYSPTNAPKLRNRRRTHAFWDVLGHSDVTSTILRSPMAFPAQPMKGRLLTGMGTPDIRGTQGVFTVFTTNPTVPAESRGTITRISDEPTVKTRLQGPRIISAGKRVESGVDLTITRSADGVVLDVEGVEIPLKPGDWSAWQRVGFNLSLLEKVHGVVRFHLTSVKPHLVVYASPVNIDPQAPILPISHPPLYSKDLVEKLGNYHTQGMPYDTWALEEGHLSESQFLDQANAVLQEDLKRIFFELNRFESGLFFAYIGTPDLIQHMFWRYQDPRHPNKGQSRQPRIRDAVPDIYARMDQLLGEIRKRAGADTPLMVVSDHGFGSFRRSVNVNTWLVRNGYMVLKDGAKTGADLLADVDWSRTRAYAVGFGGIYLNVDQRERHGIVKKDDIEPLKAELRKKILAWRDGRRSRVAKAVYPRDAYLSGPFANDGPDLMIGFNAGYRASWQTALGGAPAVVIENNMRKWGGDHLCDPSLVPGVIVSNRPIKKAAPTLLDVAPTIWRFFDVKPTDPVAGEALFDPTAQ